MIRTVWCPLRVVIPIVVAVVLGGCEEVIPERAPMTPRQQKPPALPALPAPPTAHREIPPVNLTLGDAPARIMLLEYFTVPAGSPKWEVQAKQDKVRIESDTDVLLLHPQQAGTDTVTVIVYDQHQRSAWQAVAVTVVEPAPPAPPASMAHEKPLQGQHNFAYLRRSRGRTQRPHHGEAHSRDRSGREQRVSNFWELQPLPRRDCGAGRPGILDR